MSALINRRQVMLGATALAAAALTRPAAAAAPRTLLNGIDISWLPEVEAAGLKLTGANGQTRTAIQLMKLNGVRLGRVRLFVDPDGANGSLENALKLGARLRAAGIAFCLDLHYSDTWADPGNQSPPAAWSDLSMSGMVSAVEQYTDDILRRFKVAGCAPTHVQLGNEIAGGMLWPHGRIWEGTPSEWQAFAQLRNAGTNALRRRLPSAKSVLHLECGGDASRVNWWLANAQTYGAADFDIVGLSYYSQWQGNLTKLAATMRLVAAGYRHKVLIAETAYPWTSRTFGNDVLDVTKSGLPNFAMTPAGQAQYIDRLQQHLRALPANRGIGLWWWEGFATRVTNPQGEVVWNGGMANSALVRPDGRALPALARLK